MVIHILYTLYVIKHILNVIENSFLTSNSQSWVNQFQLMIWPLIQSGSKIIPSKTCSVLLYREPCSLLPTSLTCLVCMVPGYWVNGVKNMTSQGSGYYLQSGISDVLMVLIGYISVFCFMLTFILVWHQIIIFFIIPQIFLLNTEFWQ